MMNIKNYTSNVSADVTISRIERLLADSGADAITKEYDNKVVTSIMFQLKFLPDKPPVIIRLPANVNACLEIFWKDYCKFRSTRSKKGKEDFRDQAARTAWKIQQDWVEVQVSLIRLGQIEAMQAFLPYAWDGHQTVYERIKIGGFKALLPPAKEGL